MIRLDEAYRFRDERGEDSQLYKWLSHQADMGLSDAQVCYKTIVLYASTIYTTIM